MIYWLIFSFNLFSNSVYNGNRPIALSPQTPIYAHQLLLQLWESMFTLVFLTLFAMNVKLLCFSYKFTLLWVYQITLTARGFYSEGGEMYQITLDLEQKPAMLELKENNYPVYCTFWKNYAISDRTIKLSFLL